MALLDFLGNIGTAPGGAEFNMAPQPNPYDPVGPIVPGTPGLPGIFGGQQAPEPPQPAAHHSGLRDFLGHLGDALLVGNGAEPIYGPKKERERLGAELSSYLGTGDAQLAQIMRDDPQTGLALLKMKQGTPSEGFTLSAGQMRYGPDGKLIAEAPGQNASDDTTFIKTLKALHIDPDSPEAKRLYYASVSPAGYLISPQDGGSASQSSAVPPDAIDYLRKNPGLASQFDQKYGAGASARVLGGGAGDGTGGFPGR